MKAAKNLKDSIIFLMCIWDMAAAKSLLYYCSLKIENNLHKFLSIIFLGYSCMISHAGEPFFQPGKCTYYTSTHVEAYPVRDFVMMASHL